MAIVEFCEYAIESWVPQIYSWNKASVWGSRPNLYYCMAVVALLMWNALSDERTVLSFARATVTNNKSVVSMYNLYFTCYYIWSRDSTVGIATGFRPRHS
jgi:predicted branched-subunit amino acid permease